MIVIYTFIYLDCEHSVFVPEILRASRNIKSCKSGEKRGRNEARSAGAEGTKKRARASRSSRLRRSLLDLDSSHSFLHVARYEKKEAARSLLFILPLIAICTAILLPYCVDYSILAKYFQFTRINIESHLTSMRPKKNPGSCLESHLLSRNSVTFCIIFLSISRRLNTRYNKFQNSLLLLYVFQSESPLCQKQERVFSHGCFQKIIYNVSFKK